MPRVILHIDMDAFFAAIEELDHPEYRGQPVIVGADPKGGRGRGVVSTCNYIARQFGVHSAMPISQAYRLCPNAIFVPPRMARYVELSDRLFEILHDFTPAVEPISIDEAFLDITGCVRLLGTPEEIAVRIKQAIRQQLGLSASIGIAPNKFIAKIASDLRKPDGLVIVSPEEVTQFLQPLPISKMWGVGPKTEAAMLKLGIHTIGDLARLTQAEAIKKFGKSGLHFWHLANGIDEREVAAAQAIKSVSLENTFEEDVADEQVIEQTLLALADNVSRILRQKQLQGKTITLKIRLQDFSTFTRSQSFDTFIDASTVISRITLKLYHEFPNKDQKIRLLGVAVSNLIPAQQAQLGLFSPQDTSDRRIDQVIDLVQNKFGPDLIKKASLMDQHSRRLGPPTDED
ncbi:MAG: DNA polymerase IV [candidate division KSB1 bacterium]|nr:DNA polymerase IV [candidate division KSB1 bacterium]MDZ7340586.1 DNA polymerase IV [candidate division KSB1 bacterium]